MKKIKCLCTFFCTLLLFFLIGCKNKDLTDYHTVGESWTVSYYGIDYAFNYISSKDGGAFIEIERKGELIIEGETIEKMYMLSKNQGNFDYVMVDDTKVEEKSHFFKLFERCYYEIGDNNYAKVFIHASNENFHGYVKGTIYELFDSNWPMHMMDFSLY